MRDKPALIKLLMGVVSVVTPFMILMISIRFLIMPSYARFAYRLPDFPDDPYGFSSEERLRWSEPSISFLVNTEDLSYLADLRFEDGEPIFNVQELRHMEDVKVVVTGMRVAMVIVMVAVLVIALVALRSGHRPVLIKAFYWGGWATIGLVVAILLFVALNFNSLYTWFHQIFFESGTWQFHPSETLIRLFPMRFWSDAFILVGVQSLLYGGLLVLATRRELP
jgi:integral membrane protein (TIGR01906 family)